MCVWTARAAAKASSHLVVAMTASEPCLMSRSARRQRALPLQTYFEPEDLPDGPDPLPRELGGSTSLRLGRALRDTVASSQAGARHAAQLRELPPIAWPAMVPTHPPLASTSGCPARQQSAMRGGHLDNRAPGRERPNEVRVELSAPVPTFGGPRAPEPAPRVRGDETKMSSPRASRLPAVRPFSA